MPRAIVVSAKKRASPDRSKSKQVVDPFVAARVSSAVDEVGSKNLLTRGRGKKLSVRVPGDLYAEAARKTGITNPTELVTAGLALIAAPDNFGAKLMARAGQLSDEFELPI